MKYSIFTVLFMSLFLFGCSQEELMVEQEEIQEVYTVRLNLSGDIQIQESPLSRAETESRDLYGIQVYKNGDYFAAGMFDNTNNMTINLLAGSNYKFVCTAIKDGKDICYYTSSDGYGSGYTFSCYYGNTLWINNNRFYYSKSDRFSLRELSNNSIKLSTGKSQQCANIDRFYGELDNYTPSVNGIVNLELKRVSFGIKVKVSNIPDGTVAVKCYNSYKTFINVSGLASDYESEGELFSMADIYSAWQYASNYTENLTLDVVWNRGVGITQSWKKTIQVKRNTMNTIRIKLGADDSDVGVGVTPEGGEMGNEEEEIPLG